MFASLFSLFSTRLSAFGVRGRNNASLREPNPFPKTARLSLRLLVLPPAYQRMQLLQTLNACSVIDVIRRALAVYDLLRWHVADGGKIVLQKKDGQGEELRIP
jgi:hypothetical protein